MVSSLPLESPLSQVPENTRVNWSWLLISKSSSSDNPRILYRISFTIWLLCHDKQHLGNQSLKQWRGEHRYVSDYHAGFRFCCFWFLNWLCVGKLILEAFQISFLRGKNRLKCLTAQICLGSKLVAVLLEVCWGVTTLEVCVFHLPFITSVAPSSADVSLSLQTLLSLRWLGVINHYLRSSSCGSSNRPWLK